MIDYAVADLSLAEQGRHQIRLAEHEMPGLMALRREYADQQPLRGARIAGCLHMTVQTAVLIETLTALGAQVRWASCNIFSTQDDAAAAVVVGPEGTPEHPQGVSIFAHKGETIAEYWQFIERIFDWSGHGHLGPNLILDDGADATVLVHTAVAAERDGIPADTSTPAEQQILENMLADIRAQDPTRFTRIAEQIIGVSEETTTGVHRLADLHARGQLLMPAINVNDSVTKSKFDNIYGIRHSLPDGINRATDVLIGGKTALVAGYGDVGKGAAQALRGQGARVIVSEIDPICALQAAMDGYQVARLETAIEQVDIVITGTGNTRVITAEHLLRLKHLAVVGNVGHFDDEIDMAGLEALPGATKTTIKPQVDQWQLPNGRSILVLSEGRLLNLGNATGHPSFVMSASFSNQVLAQLELFHASATYPIGVHRLPKTLDEKVARLHLEALGVELTELSAEQSRYLGVPIAGPYKPEHYRY